MLIVIGLLQGEWFGGNFAQQVSQVALRKIFAVLLLITANRMWTKK